MSDNHSITTSGGEMEFPKTLVGKKILLATESFGPVNGVSRTTLNLVKYLRENGAIVAVVAPEISISSSPTSTSPTSPSSISTTQSQSQFASQEMEIRLKGYPLPYNPELSVVYPVRLSELYRRTFGCAPDLIYLASPASLGFQILLQLRQQQNPVPVLLNFQTDLSGYCEILFPSPLDLWAVLVFGSVQGYLFRHECVKTVFYPSRFVRKYLEKAGVQGAKMECLRRGVDGEIFNQKKREEQLRRKLAPNGEIILVCVSRLAPEKGFEFLAEVARRLDEMDFPFHLLIVGGNRNKKVEEDIKSPFEGLREKGKVSFTGFLAGEDLARAYAAGDIFLHCSITETFGLVVLESMASGVPVVARDEGGPSEIVEHERSGYLIPPSDLDGFVAKVLKLAKNTALREKMGIESRKMAEEATWEGIGNKVAWKMVEALEEDESSTERRERNGMPNVKIPVYSWLLLSPQLRGFLGSWVTDARLAGGLGIITGVWAGLVVTWGLVKISLLARRWVPKFWRGDGKED